MRNFVVLLVMAVSLLLVGTQAHANLVSTFDTGTEGWTGLDAAYHDWTLAGWQSSGGNPGGYIKGQETNAVGGTGYFIAPSTWTGNWTQYIGGTLKYDIDIISGTSYFTDVDVIISSGSTSLNWSSTLNSAWSNWKTFEVPLTAATFGTDTATFNSVMANVTGLSIRGEYINGPESEGLDNVRITAPVPLPSALLLLSPGLLGLAALRRRFGK